MDTRIWYEGNSMLLEITRLRNERTGELLGSGSGVTITADVADSAGVAVTDSEIDLDPSLTRPGTWHGTFPDDLVLPEGTTGLAVRVTVAGGEFLTARWEIPIRVEERV